MSRPPITLVCFAVKEEARSFRNTLSDAHPQSQILITGMGRQNTEKCFLAALAERRPELVLTCGFAGGLKPELETGTVLFEADEATGLRSPLAKAGALPGRFHCANRIATTAAEKSALRKETGADAVEMESGFIRSICEQQQIPAATVRVILDTANEDLPLDFNKLMTEDLRLDGRKLALTLAKSPGKIGSLLRMQKQTTNAAKRLGEVLTRVLDQ
ncbi:MAG TPA: hypothetical protein VEC99_02685 [Clostridia bacterium]|nr:hypothetical protein [Clostridia bacterium]